MTAVGAGDGHRQPTATSLRLAPGERLLATMAAFSGLGIVHLDRHLHRLATSASAFGVPADPEAWRRAVVTTAGHGRSGGASRVRLLVDRAGTAEVQVDVLAPSAPVPVRLAVDDRPVDEGQARWRHKTTDRRAYGARADRHREADDVILVNRSGDVTETTRANLLVRTGGRWWTPPETCGCLPGVGRQVLLERGVVGLRPIARSELRRAEALAVVSSLRGWRAAVLVQDAALA